MRNIKSLHEFINVNESKKDLLNDLIDAFEEHFAAGIHSGKIDIKAAKEWFNNSEDTEGITVGEFINKVKDLHSKCKFLNESEIVLNEGSFYRLPKDIISDELYLTAKNLQNFYDSAAAGNDVDTGVIETIIRNLNIVKKAAKKFNSKEEVAGTVYEGEEVNEASVQVAGHGKPSGAKVLATVIIDMLDKQDFLHEDTKKSHKQLIDMVAKVIMDSTF